MKSSLCALITFFFALSASAATQECQLEKPIPFAGDLLRAEGLTLHDVKVNELPRFTQPENFNPKTDTLDMGLFPIQWNKKLTAFLGTNLKAERVGFVGFAREFEGSFHFRGENQDLNGVKSYHTINLERFPVAGKGVMDAVTETTVKTVGNQITAISLSFPVFKIGKVQNDVAMKIEFTGEHQTLCVLSAR